MLAIKILIFGVVNALAGFILWTCLVDFFPLIYPDQRLLVILDSLLILSLVWLMDVSYFKTIFSDPGFLERGAGSGAHNEEDRAAIRATTAAFRKKLNAGRRFIAVAGHTIRNEELDPELARRFSRMSVAEIRKELEAVYVEYIDKEIECDKCQVVKPPRAHHCAVCGRCVRRMDHHCPWVANCVGQDNLAHFLRFTGYATLALAAVCATIFLAYIVNSERVG